MQEHHQSYQRDRPQDANAHNRPERHAKRLKVKLACQECRDRKTRCNGSRPICDSCVRKKLPAGRCVYSQGDDFESSYVTALESRVQALESLLSQNQPYHVLPRVPPSSITRPPEIARSTANQEESSSTSIRRVGISPSIVESQGHDAMVTRHDDEHDRESSSGTEDSPAFLGSSSAIGFMTEVRQTLKPTSNEGQSHTPPHGVFRSKSSWFGNPQLHDEDLNVSPPDFVIPPKHTADMLLDSYWSGAHPLQPFIHRPSFMKRYESLWSGTPQSDAASLNEKSERTLYSDRVFHCKLNVTFALGCRFRSLSIQQSGPHLDKSQQTFASRATRLLNLDLMDTGTIDLVQALLLMAQYLQTKNFSNRCWVVVGMAIRVAQGVALHLDITGESQAQREERRRTWYCCILLDRVLSMTFGRPLMLQSPSVKPLPQMVDDEYLSTDPIAADCSQPADVPARTAYFVCVFKLSNITAEILRLVYSPTVAQLSDNDLDTEDYNSLLRLDYRLLGWQEELPPHLCYNRDTDTSNPNDLFLRQSHLLHHRFLHSRILLFRRVLVQVVASKFSKDSPASSSTLQNTLTRACVDICTSAAQDLLDILQPNIGTWLVPPAWFTVFLLYTAGTVLAVVFLSPSFPPSSTTAQNRSLQQSWTQCIKCLAEYRRLGAPAASKCLFNLQQMHIDDEGEKHDTEFLNSSTTAEMEEGNPYQTSEAPAASRSQGDRTAVDFRDDAEFYNFSLPDLWWPHDNMDWIVDLAVHN